MRVFYIFEIKQEFKLLYKGNESILYGILKQIYYMNKDQINYGYNLFNQLTKRIEKEQLDSILFLRMHQDIPYSKKNNKHRINNLYKDEISILEVKYSYLKIEAEQDTTSFFNILSSISHNFFVCDFYNQDYFFIDEVKTLV